MVRDRFPRPLQETTEKHRRPPTTVQNKESNAVRTETETVVYRKKGGRKGRKGGQKEGVTTTWT